MICPVASRVSREVREVLAELVVVVASPAEQERLSKVCAPGQTFKLFEVRNAAVRDARAAGAAPRIGLHEAVSRLVGNG